MRFLYKPFLKNTNIIKIPKNKVYIILYSHRLGGAGQVIYETNKLWLAKLILWWYPRERDHMFLLLTRDNKGFWECLNKK